jgi:hypothetical protein
VGGLKQQKLISVVSQFWRPEVQSQGDSRAGASESLRQNVPCFLLAVGSAHHWLACDITTVSASVLTWSPSCVSLDLPSCHLCIQISLFS